jgi:NAD-dependent deacetylase
MADPEIRRRSWQMRRDLWALSPAPNAAHRAIASLAASSIAVRVITQNVDGLHQAAGLPARKVLELHGTSRSVVCNGCGARGQAGRLVQPVDVLRDHPHRDAGRGERGESK